jgi:molybdopterin converting factor small subunit
VLLFAGLAEALGRPSLELPDAGAPATVGALESRLRTEHAALAARPFRVAVNQRYGAAADELSPGDEIALIPPVGGG